MRITQDMATLGDPEGHRGRCSVWLRVGYMADRAGDKVPEIKVWWTGHGGGQDATRRITCRTHAGHMSKLSIVHTIMQASPDATASARRPYTPLQPMPQAARSRPLISTLGWDIQSIIASSPNFHHVKRVHYTSPNAKVDIVIPEVERDGNPLVIAGWNRHPMWPKSLFNIDWLKKNGDQSDSYSSP